MHIFALLIYLLIDIQLQSWKITTNLFIFITIWNKLAVKCKPKTLFGVPQIAFAILEVIWQSNNYISIIQDVNDITYFCFDICIY